MKRHKNTPSSSSLIVSQGHVFRTCIFLVLRYGIGNFRGHVIKKDFIKDERMESAAVSGKCLRVQPADMKCHGTMDAEGPRDAPQY